MLKVFLGLGSNIGDSAHIIGSAFAALGEILAEARLSRLWRSRARYFEEQPDFLNAVVGGSTELSPGDLLAAINRIEAAHGRDRSTERSKGPRPLDIDILLFGSLIVAQDDLIIPHPGLRERKFALLPLLELDQELEDPISGEPFATLLTRLPPQGIYLREEGRYDLLYL